MARQGTKCSAKKNTESFLVQAWHVQEVSVLQSPAFFKKIFDVRDVDPILLSDTRHQPTLRAIPLVRIHFGSHRTNAEIDLPGGSSVEHGLLVGTIEINKNNEFFIFFPLLSTEGRAMELKNKNTSYFI